MEVVWDIVVFAVFLVIVMMPAIVLNGWYRRTVLLTDGTKHRIVSKTSMGMRLDDCRGCGEFFYTWYELASLAEEPYRSIACTKVEELKAMKEYEAP